VVSPSDIYVLAGLVARGDDAWTYRDLAKRLDVPLPLVQRALKRAAAANLYRPEAKAVHLPNFEEFLLHAIRFAAPARLGEVVPGVPAAWAASPMSSWIRESGDELPPVWPFAAGKVRGQALPPLHAAAITASLDDRRLGELLSVIDSLRVGDVRVRSVAEDAARTWLRETARPQQ
jgi:hypothetical protein